MPLALSLSASLSLLLSGAIFGFFYAWVCSTMWGLEAADPRVAIQAMQAMNASVRNLVFAPAFFGTGPVLILTGLIAYGAQSRSAALAFGAGGVIYILGAMLLTMLVNVPMNEALALVEVPTDIEAAAEIWADYSPTWQRWNVARTIVSGVTLALTGLGIALAAKA